MDIRERLMEIERDYPVYRRLAEAVEMHPETVRRQFRQGKPSLALVQSLVTKCGYSPRWLLTGVGPRLGQEETAWLLSQSSLAEVFSALSSRIASASDEQSARLESDGTDAIPVLKIYELNSCRTSSDHRPSQPDPAGGC